MSAVPLGNSSYEQGLRLGTANREWISEAIELSSIHTTNVRIGKTTMWHFRVMDRGEMNQDPVQDDYFNTAALDSYSDALVREAIQNSLDAKVNGSTEPVSVRITFPVDSDLPRPEDAKPYLDTLWKHIEATKVINDIPEKNGKVSFLLFEDFGTRGLVGDPELYEDPKEGDLADFFYFWRNVGRGKKQGEERGRWGLGKTMFPASSRLHAFFGLTLREGDTNALLMGQSTLSIHHINGKKHYPYGYFAVHDTKDQFALPITNQQRIRDFCSTFSIERESQTGLSVVVPYPRDEINAKDVLRSVVKHYFYPILSRDLIVEVESNGELITIDSDSIDDVVQEHFFEKDKTFLGTLKLAKWYISVPTENKVLAKRQNPRYSPRWNNELLTIGQIDDLAESLDSLQPICVRIPVHVIRHGKEAKQTHFDVVLERDPDLDEPLDEFIRSGITITGVTSLRESGIRALVIADDLPISTMLGDSENPAHTEWQNRSRNFFKKYRLGRSTLDFVKGAPQGLLRLLNKRSEQIDDTALRHLFPDPSPNKGKQTKKPKPAPQPGTKRRPKVKVDVPSRPKIFRLTPTKDGFTATLTENGQQYLPMRIRLRLAYDVRGANPYKRWNAADFSLAGEPQRIKLSGGALQEAVDNRLQIIATSPDWKLQLNGFDPKRDLIVDIRREAN